MKKRGRGRPKKIDNPNLIPRKPEELPDLDQITKKFEPAIKKICHDIRKNFYQQCRVPDLKNEIYQTVMMEYYAIWDYYKRGATDRFPPTTGYLYKCSWFRFLIQYAPKDDLYATGIHPYNTLEVPVDAEFTGSLIIIDPLYREIATQEQSLPFTEFQDKDDIVFGQVPDLMDFWYLGFSVNELAVIYNLHPETIKVRLHAFYDAVEAAGGNVLRPRPNRRKRKKNRFKLKKNRR